MAWNIIYFGREAEDNLARERSRRGDGSDPGNRRTADDATVPDYGKE